MEFSLAGLVVFLAIAAWLRLTHRPVVVGMFGSLAFGATALMTLSSIGGASPLVYSFFLLLFFASIALRRHVLRDLAIVCTRHPVSWVIVFLIVYVILGAIFMPRLFAGQTGAFVPLRDEVRIAEVPLAPVPGNITQCIYFVLSALSFFAFSILFLDRGRIDAIRQGFLVWSVLHVAMGFTDLFGKLGGVPDILSPIRSASYSMLTSVSEGGFWRIAGGCAEASSFGAITLCLLSFWFAHWRRTQEQTSLILSLALLVLLLLSTSSTAYVGGMIVALPLAYSILAAAFRGRMSSADLGLLLVGVAVMTLIVAVYLYDERIFDPVTDLINSMILNKATSASAQERAYWNMESLKSFYDTNGLGIGIGSSRASSWAVAVISQLGAIGVMLMLLLVYQVVQRPPALSTSIQDRLCFDIAYSVRACALAGLVTSSISSGDADPGLRFFLALAVLTSLRQQSARFIPLRPGGREAEPSFAT